jgi:alpha-beta hydrolase superfamily lysophospholipase
VSGPATHRRPIALLVAGALIIIAGAAAARRMALRSFERKTLNPGVLSEATPADVGLAFQRLSIPSEDRQLDGFLVRAGRGCAATGSVLIFHGRHETIADWVKAQRVLADGCVSSLVFDYSGHGRSSGPGTVAHLNADAVAAYQTFLNVFPGAERRCIMSHSLGAGPLVHALARAERKPDCVVLASAYSSFRDLAVQSGLPRALRLLLPDVWNNVDAARRLDVPLLWVHSRADTTIPLELGRRLFTAYRGPKIARTLDGYGHNAIYKETPAAIWSPIVAFVIGGS